MKSRKAWVQKRSNRWYVYWYDPETGSQRSKSLGSRKSDATQFAAEKTAQLLRGEVDGYHEKAWKEFAGEFVESQETRVSISTLEEYERAIKNFGRIAAPKSVSRVTGRHIDRFIAKRLQEPARKPGNLVSRATVNKELRGIKKALRKAVSWKYLAKCPVIEFLKEDDVAPTFVSEEEFAEIYGACDIAQLPSVRPGEWWQCFILFAYLTGWRYREILALRKQDLDLKGGFATTRASDNKASKEARIPLHPSLVDHLRSLVLVGELVFPWEHGSRTIHAEFARIQEAAGVQKVCRKSHKCNDQCKVFGFHDLRRGFATNNAQSLSAQQLQVLMRHSSYSTTEKYVNMAAQVERDATVQKISVPNLPKRS